jgi:hypothetical protein
MLDVVENFEEGRQDPSCHRKLYSVRRTDHASIERLYNGSDTYGRAVAGRGTYAVGAGSNASAKWPSAILSAMGELAWHPHGQVG